MAQQRRKLGAAFAPEKAAPGGVQRGAGFSDLLPKKSTHVDSPPLSGGESRPEPATADPSRPAAPKAPVSKRSKSARSKAVGRPRKRNVPVYLTDADYDALRARAAETGQSYAEIVVEAFKTVSDVGALFRPEEPDSADDDVIPEAPASVAERLPTGTNLCNIRFTDAQRAWIDKQWREKGAPSRTAFVATVLNAHLGVSH